MLQTQHMGMLWLLNINFLFNKKIEPYSLVFLEKRPLLSSRMLSAKNSPLLFRLVHAGWGTRRFTVVRVENSNTQINCFEYSQL